MSEDLSAGELAYMQSGGRDVTALEQELGGGAGDAGAQGGTPPMGGKEGEPAGGPVPGQDGVTGKEPVQDPVQGQQRDDKGRFVPVQALHEERTKRQTIEKEFSDFRTKAALAEGRLAALSELIAPKQEQQKQQQEEPIDPEKDIFGAFRQLMSKYAALEQQVTEKTQRIEGQTEAQRIGTAYRDDARRYIAQEPAFGDAYRHLMNVRGQELELLGVADQAERTRIIAQEEQQIVAQAAKSGRSPAETIFALAKARGFTPKQQIDTQEQQKADAQKKLEELERGRAASPSLSGAGSSGNAGLTMQQLADMSEEEYERVRAKLSDADVRRLMGG